MAQRIVTTFIDDLDGSEAEGTVRFGLDGAAYEIDLNRKNAEALRGALAPFAEAGRRTSNGAVNRRQRAQAVASRATVTANGAKPSDQREYLQLLGHDIKDRGRIPANLAAIHIPPRDQWPAARTAPDMTVPSDDEVAEQILAADTAELAAQHAGEPVGSIEDDTPAEPATKSPAAIAKDAVDAILPEPAAAPAVKGKAGGYDEAFRDKAVLMTMTEGASVASVARELGIAEGSIRNWRKQYQARQPAK